MGLFGKKDKEEVDEEVDEELESHRHAPRASGKGTSPERFPGHGSGRWRPRPDLSKPVPGEGGSSA